MSGPRDDIERLIGEEYSAVTSELMDAIMARVMTEINTETQARSALRVLLGVEQQSNKALLKLADHLQEKVRNQRREINLITRHMTNQWGVQFPGGGVGIYNSEQEAVDGAGRNGGEVVHRYVTTWEPRDMVLRKCPGCPARVRDLSDPHAHKFDCSWWNPRRERKEWPTPTR